MTGALFRLLAYRHSVIHRRLGSYGHDFSTLRDDKGLLFLGLKFSRLLHLVEHVKRLEPLFRHLDIALWTRFTSDRHRNLRGLSHNSERSQQCI